MFPIQLAALSKAWVYGNWFAETVGSNSASESDDCLL